LFLLSFGRFASREQSFELWPDPHCHLNGDRAAMRSATVPTLVTEPRMCMGEIVALRATAGSPQESRARTMAILRASRCGMWTSLLIHVHGKLPLWDLPNISVCEHRGWLSQPLLRLLGNTLCECAPPTHTALSWVRSESKRRGVRAQYGGSGGRFRSVGLLSYDVRSKGWSGPDPYRYLEI